MSAIRGRCQCGGLTFEITDNLTARTAISGPPPPGRSVAMTRCGPI